MIKNKLLFLFFSVIIGLPTIVYGQLTKTLGSTIQVISDTKTLEVNILNSDVVLKTTKSSRIIVETEVKTTLNNPKILDYLCITGRYDLKIINDKTTNSIIISAPNNHEALIIKGKEMEEHVIYTLHVPKKLLNDIVLPDNVELLVADS